VIVEELTRVQDAQKMNVFLGFIFNEQTLNKWLKDEWCAHPTISPPNLSINRPKGASYSTRTTSSTRSSAVSCAANPTCSPYVSCFPHCISVTSCAGSRPHQEQSRGHSCRRRPRRRSGAARSGREEAVRVPAVQHHAAKAANAAGALQHSRWFQGESGSVGGVAALGAAGPLHLVRFHTLNP
jgi:hypothetical protein